MEYQDFLIAYRNSIQQEIRSKSDSAYVLCRGTTGHDLLVQCRGIAPAIVEAMRDADTDIRFLYLDDQLYMVRNLLDSRFQPYREKLALRAVADCCFVPQCLPTVSCEYNRPLHWEAVCRIPGLRFSLAHCSWPWYDEAIAAGGSTQPGACTYGSLPATGVLPQPDLLASFWPCATGLPERRYIAAHISKTHGKHGKIR